MNTDDIRIPGRLLRDIFLECCQSYENLRGYVADRYDDPEPDVNAWLREKGAAYVEDVAKADAWHDRFFEAFRLMGGALREYDAESDEIVQVVYEDALLDGAGWAEEAHESRRNDHA